MEEKNKQPLQVREDQNNNDSGQINLMQDRLLSSMMRANDIARIADRTDMIQGMIDLMMEITLAEVANFFQLDANTDELVITHVCGSAESQHLIGLRLSRQQKIPGLTLCDTKMAVAGVLSPEMNWLRVVDPLNTTRLSNVINLPVISQGRTLGIIQLFNYHHAALDLLMALGERLALEMDHRDELTQTQFTNHRLLTLVDILGKITGTLDRNRLLNLVTESASELVDAERSSVFLVNPGTREMAFQVAYQKPDAGSPARSEKDSGAAAKPAAKRDAGKKLGEKTTQKVNRQEDEFSHFNRSAITVPLRGNAGENEATGERKQVLGGLMVFNKRNTFFKEEDAQLMEILARQVSNNLQIAEMYESAGELFLGVIKALASAIDAKDPYTQGHSQRVSDFSVLIAQELGFEDTWVNDLRIGSLFHDIGKIGIPDEILLKNGKLNDSEFEFIKLHPYKGVNILSQVKLLEPMVPAILEHHERLDGSGYPAKLAGQQISWMGRIVAVADVYDAMTSTRPYRAGFRHEEVLAHLRRNAGIQFDPDCVQALETILSSSNQRQISGGTSSLKPERLL